MYKAVKTVRCCPDGFTAVSLVEGRSYEFGPSFADFMLHRGFIERETKPAPVAREVKRRRTKKVSVEK